MAIDAKTEVKGSELAATLGLTVRRIQQLAQDGILATVIRGKFNLFSSVQAYIAYRETEKPISKAETDKLAAEVAIKKARAVMMASEAKEVQGMMHRSEDVMAITQDFVYMVRNALLSLPGILAIDLAAISDPAEAAQRIRDEVFSILRGLVDYEYDPKRYAERVRDRLNWEHAGTPANADI
jgi:phage terminase Nu1 subunit (DNA packaging protein)